MDATLALATKSIGHSGPRVTNEQDFPLSEWCVRLPSMSCSKLAAELVAPSSRGLITEASSGTLVEHPCAPGWFEASLDP